LALSLPKQGGQLGLNFLNLMQLKVAARIVGQTDISLQKLRLFLQRSKEVLAHDHPFATARFRTDGRAPFLEVGREADEPVLYDVLGGQLGFHRVIEPSFKDVSIDGDELTLWWPLGKNRTVVLDPKRSCGAPIVHGGGIPTATLALSAAREGSARAVMRGYPASEREVRDAVVFERQMAASPDHRQAA
jgi:uncharacterized protein (DUF433 family)